MRNPLTKEAFAAWCEQQSANEEYDFCLPDKCAAAQYLRSIGDPNYRRMPHELPDGWRDCLNPNLGHLLTFGALAIRLRS